MNSYSTRAKYVLSGTALFLSAVCMGVLRKKVATGGAAAAHLQDIIVALNFNDYYDDVISTGAAVVRKRQ